MIQASGLTSASVIDSDMALSTTCMNCVGGCLACLERVCYYPGVDQPAMSHCTPCSESSCEACCEAKAFAVAAAAAGGGAAAAGAGGGGAAACGCS